MVKRIVPFKDRFEEALNIRDKKPIDIHNATGISQSTLSQYQSGYSEPKKERLSLIADVLSVNPAWLLGLDVPMDSSSAYTPTTIAAHLDADDLTEDELDDVANYIELVKKRRNK